jgi:murein DD-endopeptidase MepM/ murein hydrolase activator NlpD
MDFVHNKASVPHVPVIAVAKGTVAYVRTGCPQSCMFAKNKSLREAGAGWGNHLVLYHGNGIYTRYAHLAPGSIKARVGDQMIPGDVVGEMGNSGRSEVRHLHFEVGYKGSYFVAGKPSQSFDLVQKRRNQTRNQQKAFQQHAIAVKCSLCAGISFSGGRKRAY